MRALKQSATKFPSPLFCESDPPSKRAIVSAALRLFVKNGFDVTTIRDIAAGAGYTNPALFKFFKTKEELGVYLFEKTYTVLMEKLEPYFKDVGPLDDVLGRWVSSYLELLKDNLEPFLFVHDHLGYFWPKTANRFGNKNIFKHMRQWLEVGRKQGRISESISIEVQTAAVSGFFHQIARMIYLGQIDLRKSAPIQSGSHEMLLRMLRPEGSVTINRRIK